MSMSEGSTGTMMASALFGHIGHFLRRHRSRRVDDDMGRVGRYAHLPGTSHA